MPTKHKRVMLTPDTKALVFLGLDPGLARDVSGAALAGAITRYADLLQEVSGDLARVCTRRAVWDMLADVMRPTRFPAGDDEYPAHIAIVQSLESLHRDRRIGERWLLYPNERLNLTHEAASAKADLRLREVCDGFRALTSVHGGVVLAGVRWYWAHHDELEDATGDWWLPAARWKWFESREKARAKACPATVEKQPSLFEEEPRAEKEA